jgi:hypothetical protein
MRSLFVYHIQAIAMVLLGGAGLIAATSAANAKVPTLALDSLDNQHAKSLTPSDGRNEK